MVRSWPRSSVRMAHAATPAHAHTHTHAGKVEKWSGLNEARETRRDELNEGEKRSFPLHHILICCDCIHSQVCPGPDGPLHTHTHTQTKACTHAHAILTGKQSEIQ